MGFVNEYISDEDLNKYGIQEIWDEFHPYSKNDLNLIHKHSWTVDKKECIFFMPVAEGKEEFSNRQDCILGWKDSILRVTLDQLGSVNYKTEIGTRIWRLVDIWKPEDFAVKDQDIVSALKEALLIYGDSGVYDSENLRLTTEFEF